jgi:hypothetical protein
MYVQMILGISYDYLLPWLAGTSVGLHPGFGTVVTIVAALTTFFRVVKQFVPPQKT